MQSNWWNSLENFITTFGQSIAEPAFYFTSPDKRLYYAYLLAAICIGLIFLCLVQSPKKTFLQNLKSIFDKNIWLHKSSLLDIKLIFTNSLIKGFLILPWAISSITIATFIIKSFRFFFGESPSLHFSDLSVAVLFTAISYLISDFFRFYFHYLLHKFAFLWEIHKVHHSAIVMTPLTVHRAHPIESIISTLRNALSTGMASGIFIYLFANQVTGFDIIGVNVFGFLFNIIGSNLRHSHIRLSYGPLEYLFLSPAQHQIHHGASPKHHHKNMGIGLSLWDQIWGTFHIEKKYKKIDFGLEHGIINHDFNLVSAIFSPIKQGLKKYKI